MINTHPYIFIEKECNTIQCVGYFQNPEKKVIYGVKKDIGEFFGLCNWIIKNLLRNDLILSDDVIEWLILEAKRDPNVLEMFKKSGFTYGKS